MRVNGRGGYAAISAGNPTAVTAPPDWAATEEYQLDQVVSAGAGAMKVEAQCIIAHTAAASGLTVTSGSLSGPDASNWRQVPTGALTALRNWSFDISESTEAITYVNEQSDRDVGTTITTTGQLVVADDDEDGYDVARRALETGNTFTMKLYPKGVATGRPVRTGATRITGESGAFSTSLQERTFAFSVQGKYTRTYQA